MAISMKRNVESQDLKFDVIEKMHSKIGLLKPSPTPNPMNALFVTSKIEFSNPPILQFLN